MHACMTQQEKGSNSGVARRHAIGQALGRLALAAGVGSWAAGTRPMGGLLPANAETTAVKKVRALLV